MAEKGKWAEGEVRDALTAVEKENMRFTFNRIPDAKGGFMQPATADFQWFYAPGTSCSYHQLAHKRQSTHGVEVVNRELTFNGLIEVKEVEHLKLLPHGNFSSDKITRAWNRHIAGSTCWVLVAHKLKGMRKPQVTWRAVPLKFFKDTVYVRGVGSWDLSEFPLIDMPAFVKGLIE